MKPVHRPARPVLPVRAAVRGSALGLLLVLAGCAGLEPAPFAGVEPPPPVTDASIERGRALLATGEYDLAYRTFIQHLRTGDRPAAAFSGAALALEAQGLLYQSQDLFERARDLAPGSATVHNNLGVVYYKLGEYELARQSFRTAFAVSSGQNGMAAHNMAAAERAIEARRVAADPAITMALTRTGRGAYELSAIEGAGPVGETIYTPSPLEGLPAPVETVTLAVAAPEPDAPEQDRLADLPAPPSSGAPVTVLGAPARLPDAAQDDLRATLPSPPGPERTAEREAPADATREAAAHPPMPHFQPAPDVQAAAVAEAAPPVDPSPSQSGEPKAEAAQTSSGAASAERGAENGTASDDAG